MTEADKKLVEESRQALKTAMADSGYARCASLATGYGIRLLNALEALTSEPEGAMRECKNDSGVAAPIPPEADAGSRSPIEHKPACVTPTAIHDRQSPEAGAELVAIRADLVKHDRYAVPAFGARLHPWGYVARLLDRLTEAEGRASAAEATLATTQAQLEAARGALEEIANAEMREIDLGIRGAHAVPMCWAKHTKDIALAALQETVK